MEVWITILCAVVFLTVTASTVLYFKKNEKSFGKRSQATGIVSRYWQVIVLVSVGMVLVIVYLVNK